MQMYMSAFQRLPRELLVKAQLDKVCHNSYHFESRRRTR